MDSIRPVHKKRWPSSIARASTFYYSSANTNRHHYIRLMGIRQGQNAKTKHGGGERLYRARLHRILNNHILGLDMKPGCRYEGGEGSKGITWPHLPKHESYQGQVMVYLIEKAAARERKQSHKTARQDKLFQGNPCPLKNASLQVRASLFVACPNSCSKIRRAIFTLMRFAVKLMKFPLSV